MPQVIDSCAEDGQPLFWEQKVNTESGVIEVMGHYVIDTHLQRASLTHAGMAVVLQRLGEPSGRFTSLLPVKAGCMGAIPSFSKTPANPQIIKATMHSVPGQRRGCAYPLIP